MSSKEYAKVVWSPEDVMELFDVTEAEAILFLEKNQGHIRDRMTAYGWNAIEVAGQLDELKPRNGPDEPEALR